MTNFTIKKYFTFLQENRTFQRFERCDQKKKAETPFSGISSLKMDTKPKKARKPRAPIDTPTAVPTITPRFELGDAPAWNKYLDENGYVVIKGVANEQEIKLGKELAWEYLETVCPGLSRTDPTTWSNHFPDPYGKGIISGDGCGHSKLLWHARGIEILLSH